MSPEDMELKKAGLKVTLPRIKILQILENTAERHMTAEDIYQSLRDADEDVGIATVYRVLTQFETAGLVERHNFDYVDFNYKTFDPFFNINTTNDLKSAENLDHLNE